MENKELVKWVATLILLALAAFFIYDYYNQTNETQNIAEFLKQGKKQVGYAESLEFLTKAGKICIIEDITETADPIRKNIMDCGINFASTLPFFEKDMKVYAIENNKCFSSEGEREIFFCSNEIKEQKCFVLFLGSNQSVKIESYENLLFVPVGEKLNENDCKIIS